jgi:hypothetical protein
MKTFKRWIVLILIFIQNFWLRNQIKNGKEFEVITLPTLKNIFVGLRDSRKSRILKEAKKLIDNYNNFLFLGIPNKEAQKFNILTGTMKINTREDSEGWPTGADISVTVTIDYKKILNYRKDLKWV